MCTQSKNREPGRLKAYVTACVFLGPAFAGRAIASGQTADEATRAGPDSAGVSEAELDDFVEQFKHVGVGEQRSIVLYKLMSEHGRERLETLLRAAQTRRPTDGVWAVEWVMLAATDSYDGRKLTGQRREEHFRRVLAYLRESYEATQAARKDAKTEEERGKLTQFVPMVQEMLAQAALEAGDAQTAKQQAEELLKSNTDPNDRNHQIIHNCNEILGRVALRDGRIEDAKSYLLKAGSTPGSSALNFFGPSFVLARELLEKHEREVVLQYLDMVGQFWGKFGEFESNDGVARMLKEDKERKAALLEQWKDEIRAGKIPKHEIKWKLAGE